MLKRIKKRQVIVVVFILIFGVGAYFLNQIEKTQLYERDGRSFEKAEVVKIIQDNKKESGQRVGKQTVELKILTGKYNGEIVQAYSSASYLYGAYCKVGMKVIASINESKENLYVNVYSYNRTPVLGVIVLLFMLSIWVIGGKQGFHAVLGLIFTFICIIYVFIPMIYRGISPILSAAFVVILITIVTMYLIGGGSKKTLVSISATILGVIFSGIIAIIIGKAAQISGYNVGEIEQLEYVGQMTNIKIGELLYAGILISSLGAVMDVAMSISSTIYEINSRTSELSLKELFQSGIHVGRDMMGTMSNTLILAFTGGSINTLVFLYAYNYSSLEIINMYSIGIEILQGVSATMGVILTVPIVSYISAFMLKQSVSYKN